MRAIIYLAFLASLAAAGPIMAAPHDGEDRGIIRHPPYGYPTTGCPEASQWSTSTYIPAPSTSVPSVVTTMPVTISTYTSSSSVWTSEPVNPSPTPIFSTSSTSSTTASATTTFSTTFTASATRNAPTCSTTVSPPAPTQSGVIPSCSQWYVAVSGDFCYTIADKFGIDVNTFMAWNPAVLPPGCTQLLAGDAYCVQVCGNASVSSISTSFASVPTPTSTSTSSVPAPSSTLGPSSPYHAYCGNGSVAAGWPDMDQWLEFDDLFERNEPSMKISCEQWGVPNDSDDEIEDMKSSIYEVADLSGIDSRFILATIMQESEGCVRVITTQYSHDNPGLMKSFNGTGSCNRNHAYLGIADTLSSYVATPCPRSEIYQMISDGTNGTPNGNQGNATGDGLRQNFAQQGLRGAVGYYRTAKIYNGGIDSFRDNEDSLERGCCTSSYVSDIANRLMGWTNVATREFTC